MHPDRPIVVTSPGLALSWEESAGAHGVTILLGQPTGARLHEAIQDAIGAAQPLRRRLNRRRGGQPVGRVGVVEVSSVGVTQDRSVRM